jgi:hypothetical protein
LIHHERIWTHSSQILLALCLPPVVKVEELSNNEENFGSCPVDLGLKSEMFFDEEITFHHAHMILFFLKIINENNTISPISNIAFR